MNELDIDKLIPSNSVDCVIISYENRRLYVLLLKWKGTILWGVPGGFIYKDEDMDQAAERVLKERTGIESPFLSQFHTFGKANRRGGIDLKDFLINLGIKSSAALNWFDQRFITTAYIALVNKSKNIPKPDLLSSECKWIPLDQLPELVFDHRSIINKALEQIEIQINYLPIGINLLQETFTMKDLQTLYESILNKPLYRSNFQSKILKLDILVRLEKLKSGGAHKAPYLYRFDKVKYEELLKKGIGFVS